MSRPLPDIRAVAHLARVELTTEEAARYGAQLDDLLRYVEQLAEVDVSGVEPTAHALPRVNVTRPDQVSASLPREEALRNAPARGQDLFLVPKIVE
jgi:aspartyl-tRNA(Asn)/glutamyl-tRNA(Gln) amidotransferase subunit C